MLSPPGTANMEPAVYTGTLRHRRFEPKRHQFSYRLFMVLLDIDRIPEAMRVSPFTSYHRFNLSSFYPSDHFGDPALSLRVRLEADAATNGLVLPEGPVLLLTHPRYLGYVFNPISVYYCFDRTGELKTIAAEVRSTFGETHVYWLSDGNRESGSRSHIHRCAKKMHVSPFMPMDLEYRFALTAPEGRLVAHIAAVDSSGRSSFDATLTLQREPWDSRSIHKALLVHPWMTAKVIGSIHWEALRLWIKGVPLFPHPSHAKDSPSKS
jgi:DUF1365 family protein